MKFAKTISVLNEFDLNLLNDPNFKEDSVREEIILPILKGLGYSADKPNKIIRSKSLQHPYVSIGIATKQITIVPDYLLEISGKYAWVLEAKSPAEEITKTKHVEQAYSYAINAEVRVPYFVLCNGREFVLYHISKIEPILSFNMIELGNYWESLVRLLSPSNVLDYDLTLAKDFGLHLKRLGFNEFQHLIFPFVPIRFIAKVENDLYTFGSGLSYDGEVTYAVSFDFDSSVLIQLVGHIPQEAIDLLNQPYEGTIKKIVFSDATFYINVDCKVCENFRENDEEIYLGLSGFRKRIWLISARYAWRQVD